MVMHWCCSHLMRRCQRSKTGCKKRYFGSHSLLWGGTQCISWKNFGQHRAVYFWQQERPGRESIFRGTVFRCSSERLQYQLALELLEELVRAGLLTTQEGEYAKQLIEVKYCL